MAEISIDKLSAAYPARRLRASDADALLEVCAGNATYFRYMRGAPDKAHIIDDLTRRPPGTDARDKYFVGFFDGGQLVAALDLIAGYPDRQTCFIGWFIVRRERQGRGFGTALLSGVLAEAGRHFGRARLAYVSDNPESAAFWKKNSFADTGETKDCGAYTLRLAERVLRQDGQKEKEDPARCAIS